MNHPVRRADGDQCFVQAVVRVRADRHGLAGGIEHRRSVLAMAREVRDVEWHPPVAPPEMEIVKITGMFRYA
jgi:hypothetical protein